MDRRRASSFRFASSPNLDTASDTSNPTKSPSKHRKLRWLRALESARFQLFIVLLVVVDIALFFLEADDAVANALTPTALVIVQSVISLVFVVEITAKVYVYGWRRFSNMSTNVIDAFIVVVTTAGTVVQLVELISSSSLAAVSDVSQGSTLVRVVRVFRLFRLFRIYRLYDVLSSVSRKRIATVAPVTPNAQVVDILQRTKQCLMTSGEFDGYVRPVELQWVLDVIRENRLGVAVVRKVEERDQAFIDEMAAGGGGGGSGGGGGGGGAHPNPRQTRLGSAGVVTAPERAVLSWDEVLGEHAADVDSLVRVLDKTLASWEFDVFLVAKLSGNRPLRAVGFAVFCSLRLGEVLGVDDAVLVRWLDKMEAGYDSNNPYHNSTHASDVLQSVYSLLVQLEMVSEFSPLQLCALVVAAVVHDYGHVGTNNHFLVATKHELALRYSDVSVLEANSIALAFAVTEREDANIFAALDGTDYRELRRVVFALVLKTDMAFHFDVIGEFEAHEQTGFDLSASPTDADVVLALLLHCADISNPAKPWALTSKWTKAVFSEFREQGKKELEAGLPVSKFMAPDDGPLEEAQCQFLFIQLFVAPLFGVLMRYVEVTRPSHVPKVRRMLECLDQNKSIHDQTRRRCSAAALAAAAAAAAASGGSAPKMRTPRLSRANLKRKLSKGILSGRHGKHEQDNKHEQDKKRAEQGPKEKQEDAEAKKKPIAEAENQPEEEANKPDHRAKALVLYPSKSFGRTHSELDSRSLSKTMGDDEGDDAPGDEGMALLPEGDEDAHHDRDHDQDDEDQDQARTQADIEVEVEVRREGSDEPLQAQSDLVRPASEGLSLRSEGAAN